MNLTPGKKPAIFKYHIPVVPETQAHHIQEGAQVLEVGVQDARIFFWAYIPDITAPKKPRYMKVLGTGNQEELVAGQYKHLGTVIIDAHVWHVCEIVQRES